MALDLKIEVKIDVSGNPLYITDKTGEYAVTTNEGGWGTPNEERQYNALMCITEKIVHDADNTFASPITNQIVYVPGAANDYETSFQFTMGVDGGYIHHLLVIPVSSDGINTLAGATIQENEYFYMTDGIVYQKQADTSNDPVTDYSILIDNENANAPTQANCQKVWTPDLSTKEAELYKEYRQAREDSTDEHVILDEGLELGFNLKHAYGAFYQGLQLEAEDIIETQREKYGL